MPRHIDSGDRLLIEQTRLLLTQLPVVIIASLLAAIIVTVALRGLVANAFLAAWVAAALMMAMIRPRLLVRWRRSDTAAGNARGRMRAIAWLSGLSGTLWGGCGAALVSGSGSIVGLVTIMVLTGLAASATASQSHARSVHLAFIVPALLPASIAFATFDESLYHWIAALILLYLTVCIAFSECIRGTAIEAIDLRFENIALIERLQHETASSIEAMRSAESANIAKSNLMAAAGHDLRQPLHALRLFTETLRSVCREPAQREIAHHIDASVKALEELFEGLLDLSRLDAGVLPFEHRHAVLRPLLERLGREMQVLARERGLGVRTHCPELTVRTDPMLLERVLRNLCVNALAATEQGCLLVRAEPVADGIRIEVQDTGRGIPAGDQQRIFDEFVQLDNPDHDRRQGIGLGLSIVRRICQLLGIGLELHSVSGQGTTFSLRLPYGEASRVDDPDSVPAAGAETLWNQFVLVIDDEQAIRLAMSAMLEQWGCHVVAVGDSRQALAELDEYDGPPDVILADLQLGPHGSGIQAIEAIRQRAGTAVAAVIMTGNIAADRLQEVRASELTVMHKPCDTVALHALLTRVALAGHVGPDEVTR